MKSVVAGSKQSNEQILTDIQKVLRNKGYKAIVLHSDREVKDFINTNIPDNKRVGLGDSITSCKLNIRHILAAKGSKIFYSWNGSPDS